MSNELTVGTRIDHERYGDGIIANVGLVSYDVYFAKGGKMEILKSSSDYSIISQEKQSGETSSTIDVGAIEKVLVHTLDKYGMLNEVVPLGSKWEGGKMILQPADTNLQSKEIPIETLFHKIVMIRDRLRVLEQNINSSEKLSDEEKVNMQQYISRAYGSLTTFNILFGDKQYYFTGSGKK